MAETTTAGETAIRIRGLTTRFGANLLHDGIDLDVARGELMGIVGGSGTGKSVLLRTILGLNLQAAGTIEVLGQDTARLTGDARHALERSWGVLFQDGALFSALTVAENVMLPIKEHTRLRGPIVAEIAALKIALAGLPPEASARYPSELSGGMRKRAGLARALALDPQILFLDEPTAGLDPIGANAFDVLIRDLQRNLGLTVVMVTHDLDSIVATCDRVAVLVDRRIIVGTLDQMRRDSHPWINAYFNGPRGRAAHGD